MRHFDAIVVGGGPAGSTCARALIRGGMRVALLDRKEFPRDKVCAGWVTPEVLQSLELNLADYAAQRVLQPIHAFRTGLIEMDGTATPMKNSADAITTDYGKTVSYGIRRYEFDDYLLRRSGAELLLGDPLKQLLRTRDGWELNGRWRAPLLIGAGGHYCPVARHLGADLGRSEQPVTAQEIELPLDGHQRSACAVRSDTPELYFCRDLRGYGWCFRKGDWLNVGLGREGEGALSRQVAAFIAFLRHNGRIPGDLPPRLPGHAYLLYRRPAPRPLVDDGALLIGDAAGVAYPRSGEGIRPAVESALIAADTILHTMGGYSRAELAVYEARLRARFGPGDKGSAHKEIGHWLAKRLLASRSFTRYVVLNRWFLHRGQPAL